MQSRLYFLYLLICRIREGLSVKHTKAFGTWKPFDNCIYLLYIQVRAEMTVCAHVSILCADQLQVSFIWNHPMLLFCLVWFSFLLFLSFKKVTLTDLDLVK